MSAMSDLHVQLGEQGIQEGGWRLWLQESHRVKRPLQLRTHDWATLSLLIEEVAHDLSDQDAPVCVPKGVRLHEGVDAGNEVVPQGDRPPALYHAMGRSAVAHEAVCVRGVVGTSRKAYALAGVRGDVAQAAGSTSMPDDSLLVAPPSIVRLEPYPGGATKADKASPSAATQRASGSNSQNDALQYGECRHCPRTFLMRRNDAVPLHHNPMVSERGPHPLCPGSRESPGSYLEV